MAARPEPTVALSIRELRDPNEFDLALLDEEGAEYGAVRARGARVLPDAPKEPPAPRYARREPRPLAPPAAPRRARPSPWLALGFGALTLASAITTWLLLTAR